MPYCFLKCQGQVQDILNMGAEDVDGDFSPLLSVIRPYAGFWFPA